MNNFRGLKLTTRYSQDNFDGYAHILAYDDELFEDAIVSQDIRNLFEDHPNTAYLYLLAPFCSFEEIIEGLVTGTSLIRSKSYLSASHEHFCVITMRTTSEKVELVSHKIDISGKKPKICAAMPLPDSLIHGWLYDLFNRHQGKVDAPMGVHFRKGSGKHTEHFLRAANCLLSSAECTTVAFFCTAYLPKYFRKILVDTAPIISIAYSLLKIAQTNHLLHSQPSIKSFSSYGGLESIPPLTSKDLILISASTSGSLRNELIEKGAKPENIITLFYLQSEGTSSTPNGTICDLTFRKGQSYGYQKITNHPTNNCPLCKNGLILAEFEGDQFLLQKRKVTNFRVTNKSQASITREIFEKLARTTTLRTSINQRLTTPFKLDINAIFNINEIQDNAVKYISRFCPTPLQMVVLHSITPQRAKSLLVKAGFQSSSRKVKFVDFSNLSNQRPIPNGGALVLFGYLDNHAEARQINATLRQVCPNGSIAYISVITAAQNSEKLSDLKIFLEYGENGKETFLFRSVHELAMPEWSSAWESELNLLNEIDSNTPLKDQQIQARIQWIAGANFEINNLFLQGKNGPLKINKDFVYLNTQNNIQKISQSDIFATVSNLLITARHSNVQLWEKATKDTPPKFSSNIYGQNLLSPKNFLDYNDAILKASFLRAANPTEMLYALDDEHSYEMSKIIQTEINGWGNGAGDALPEFLLALATKRMQLTEKSIQEIKRALAGIALPNHLKLIEGFI